MMDPGCWKAASHCNPELAYMFYSADYVTDLPGKPIYHPFQSPLSHPLTLFNLLQNVMLWYLTL